MKLSKRQLGGGGGGFLGSIGLLGMCRWRLTNPTPQCLFLVYFVPSYGPNLSRLWAVDSFFSTLDVPKNCDPFLVLTILKIPE